MRHMLLVALSLGLCATVGQAQKSLLYTHVTLHDGKGGQVQDAVLGVKEGKISLLGGPQTAYQSGDYEQVIDGKGAHLYPGFIAPNTQLGLIEIEAVRASLDFSEVGVYNPNVRALIAYNTDSELIPTVRSNGVLLSEVVPQGGRISGSSSLLYTAGRNWEEATCLADNGIHLWWPNRFHATGWWAEPGNPRGNKNYGLDVQALQVYFDAAQAYLQSSEKRESKNLKFEALRPIFEGKRSLFVHVNEAKGMVEAVELFKKQYKLKVVLVGAVEAWQVADYLAVEKIPVVLGPVHSLPVHPDSDFDQPYHTPALLHEKGVQFCFSLEGSWQQRNLAFQAGHAVAYGLPKEAAVKAITADAAEILGLGAELGSLEVGKEATFIVSQGDALDMRTCRIQAAYIKGQSLDLDDKHQALNRKYRELLKLEEGR